ncbi:hypothetical protein BTR14_11285 [Rhizobium rhizosphaerae]|uniref:Uncharacterized protein n=1 Tax=Xaviernesmea rhizosphaerae TaxID=1672749 RepID=A0ABX3PDS5_9HYPH|nr:hypothetical protein [Xaviernesmea rhizosphaerae]OQP86271.1 hypothetical protein BTR14_11285 [Xaviernesmea rhizosphaerae]
MFKTIALCLTLAATPIAAQAQYKNYEVTPTGRCGAQGTYGNQNFQLDCSGTSRSLQLGGAKVDSQRLPPAARRNNNAGKTHSRCYVDGNGTSYCN